MGFSEIAQVFQITKYPAALEQYWPIPVKRQNELCSLQLMDRLQKRYNLFGRYYEAVKEGFEGLSSHQRAYLDAVSLFIKDRSLEEVRKLPYPDNAGTPASNMLPFLVHLPAIEDAYEAYRARGFSHEEALLSLDAFKAYLWEMEQYRAGYVGLTPDLSRWVSQFTKAMMFYSGIGGISFQPIPLDPSQSPYYLKNKNTGEILPVFGHNIAMHKSGIPLGSAGAEDPQGAFTPEFKETEDAYWGNPVRDCLVSSQQERFDKAQWSLFISPGDHILATHIFFGSDFTPEVLDQALAKGWDMAQKYYPEFQFKAQYCRSWLLCPALADILGESSKVAMFGNRFVRFPIFSLGQAVFEFVFPGFQGKPEDLPEKTSLQRKIKAKLVAGGHIYVVAGLIPN